MNVLHVITGLNRGGAEGTLCRLIAASRDGVDHAVVSLTTEGAYGAHLRGQGVEVAALHIPRGRVSFRGVLELVRFVRRAQPDVVQTWMYHADLIGGLAARRGGCPRIVWGIRHTNLAREANKRTTRMVANVCARLSYRIPRAIVCCSSEAARVHREIGYRPDIFSIIPNGFDVDAIGFDARARTELRAQWGISPGTVLMGCVARWDPQKDHGNLLRALAMVRGRIAIRCVLVGTGMDAENSGLVREIQALGIGDTVILAGRRADIPGVMSALDLHVLSSLGEAFPNVVAEAMAAGTPCVVTDVGDAASIVGDTGWVARARDPAALAACISQACAAIVARGRSAFDQACVERIARQYGQARMAEAYRSVWNHVRQGIRIEAREFG